MAKSAVSTVRTLRKVYGQSFAAGHPETEKLREVLLKLNETSLSQLRRDYGVALKLSRARCPRLVDGFR
jgi:hypothetical protein